MLPASISATRISLTPTPTPTLNQKLAAIYADAEQKVSAGAKRKKDSSKDAALLARFKGEFPPTLVKVMAGEGVKDGVGFHQLAMQIAITANALGKPEDLMLKACGGLIQNHQSDGSRYNSPAKRKAELSRMYHYTNDNVCYTYSKDALRAVAPEGADTKDLDGITVEGEALSVKLVNYQSVILMAHVVHGRNNAKMMGKLMVL